MKRYNVLKGRVEFTLNQKSKLQPGGGMYAEEPELVATFQEEEKAKEYIVKNCTPYVGRFSGYGTEHVELEEHFIQELTLDDEEKLLDIETYGISAGFITDKQIKDL